MQKEKNIHPPRILLAIFRWYCDPRFREELEGDLTERFQKQVEQYGPWKARMRFLREVMSLCRPPFAGFNHLLQSKWRPDMKNLQWLQLIAFNLLIILGILLPFLPGPYDKLSLGFSWIAQLVGFIGLPLVLIGILWLIQEIRMLVGKTAPVNNWQNGYNYALSATCVCTFISLFIVIASLITIGPSAAVITLCLIILSIYKIIPSIKKLRINSLKPFNPLPLYLISVPLIAFVIHMFLIGPVSDYSRNYAIGKAQIVISEIEDYYQRRNQYPESLKELRHVPHPSIMGISEFRYERNGEGYNLSFLQFQHFGATEEVVMYNKMDEHNVKGHFASFSAKQPHWRYYWLD